MAVCVREKKNGEGERRWEKEKEGDRGKKKGREIMKRKVMNLS